MNPAQDGVTAWYTCTHAPDAVTIEFQPSPNRYWPPEIIRTQPIQVASLTERQVIVTGAGAVWMYAHAAAMAQSAKAATQVRLAGSGEALELEGSSCELLTDGDSSVLKIHLRSNPRLAEAAIRELLAPHLRELAKRVPKHLCVTGQANGLAYALAAEQAIHGGVERLICWTPVDGLVVVFDRSGSQLGERLEPPPWLERVVKRPAYPVIVGVTGDPNGGKSVFSLALNHYRGQIGCSGWRLDCDGASPTTQWYLSWSQVDWKQAQAAREAHKRTWSPEMEVAIAHQLRRLRRFFDVTIADLPGGNHKIVPASRVPGHREVIFREVDVLILIERADTPTELAWRDALRPHQLDDRIAVVLRSSNPNGNPRLEVWQDASGLWRGVVEGLDRSQQPDSLAAAFRGGLERLWPVILQHGRKDTGN